VRNQKKTEKVINEGKAQVENRKRRPYRKGSYRLRRAGKVWKGVRETRHWEKKERKGQDARWNSPLNREIPSGESGAS